jgi:diguanylate cyclase (GGDEF)-like protein
MQIVAYPALVMASIAFFVGGYHLSVFLKRRKPLEHLPFALLCFSVTMYDVFSVGLYNSRSLAEGIFWQGLQLQTVDVISIFLIWFVLVFTGKKQKTWIPFVLWFALLLGASLFLDPDLTLSPLRPSIKRIVVPGFLRVTYFEGELGAVYIVALASSLAAYIYLLVILIRNQSEARKKGSLVIVAGLLAYFAGVVNDILVASRIYPFLYLSEYSFLIIVLAMSYVLLSEFARLHQAVEEANRNLEAKVEERTGEIRKLNEDLRRMAELDPLTGIYNRRFFGEYLEIELRRAKNRLEHKAAALSGANDMNFGLAIIDVDHFKLVNDRFGHQAGDRVLVEIAKHIQDNLFTRDVLCRYGGEEFVVLFTRTSKEGIIQAVEKIRRGVAGHRFQPAENQAAHPVTVSIGAVIFEDVSELSSEQILHVADERLLAAKAGGRNRVICE